MNRTRRGGWRRLVLAVAILTAAPGTAWSYPDTSSQGDERKGPLTTRELVELRGLSGLTVSPSGKQAAVRIDQQILSDNRVSIHWLVVDLQSGASHLVASAGEPLWNLNGGLDSDLPQWSPDGRWIYFRKLADTQVQVWRARVDNGSSEQITHDPADVLAFTVDADGAVHYAIRGATRAEIIAAERDEYDAGVLMDRTIIPGFPMARSFPINGRMAVQRRLLPSGISFGRAPLLGDRPLLFRTHTPDGSTIPATDMRAVRQLQSWWEESGGGLSPFDPPPRQTFVAPGGEGFVYLGGEDTSQEASRPNRAQPLAMIWQSAGGESLACSDPVCQDVDKLRPIAWTTASAILFQTRARGVTGLHVWDVLKNRTRTILETERVLGSDTSGTQGACRLANGKSVCIGAGADVPPGLVTIDLETGEERELLNPNPEITADRLGIAATIHLQDGAGSETLARLILPRVPEHAGGAAKRWPLVITSYSCDGFLVGGTGQDVPEHVLAGLGYAALCMDLTTDNVRRPSAWSGPPDAGMLGFAGDAVEQLARAGVIDPDRIVLSGFSGSATGTTYALTHSSNFTAAIITTQGVLDPIHYYMGSLRSGLRSVFAQGGAIPPFDTRTNAYYNENSPSWNAERITAPLLMQLADVEYVSMMQLLTTMTDLKRGVEMFVFPDEYHAKRMPRHRLAVYNRNVDWVNFWLRGVENSAASAEGQRARWRAMRRQQCQSLAATGVPDSAWYCGVLDELEAASRQ